ncbi:hypothetical protein IY145_08485 [Methylosinus sp. H3A]|uniref:hypothetical protein n=1 Tax=Methylosinus sp. H3A TaxID=2785786 RepID=UPI0018C2FF92|nr:hypothetical protein [Methylosinus sp. H3A]MBG0809414.1 hypothetical protein [Methylosinus sp. H3A]
MQTTFIRNTDDGRKVEVVGPYVCVDGKPVADSVVEVKDHPNRFAILHTLPNAAFMAGPVVLTAEEASVVRGALLMAKPSPTDPVAINEQLRHAVNARNRESGIE